MATISPVLSLTPLARRELGESLHGRVSFEPTTLGLYATDASHYQQTPLAVVIAQHPDDVRTALRLAHRHKIPVTPRGGGTSLSGQTFGPGIVIDVSQHLDQTLEINLDDPYARVQPGVVRDQLNDQLKPHGHHFAPDPATGNRATIAGMIGNNAAGMRSIRYGQTIDHVLELTVALCDEHATVITLGPESAEQWGHNSRGESAAARIHRGVRHLIEDHHGEIQDHYPKVMRRVAGYALDRFALHPHGSPADRDAGLAPVPPGQRWNLAHLICGSEGTLAFILEAKIRLTPLPAATAMCVVQFDDVLEALGHVQTINATNPSAVELLDQVVLTEARRNPATRHMATFIHGDPAAMLIVEYAGPILEATHHQARQLADRLSQNDIGHAHRVYTTASEQAHVWNTRKLGLGLISNTTGPVKGQAFVEDAAIPLPHLREYARRLTELCQSLDVPCSLYGHASVGVIHFRPMLDLHREDHRETMRQIAEQAFAWCCEFHGCFSGEHGDGLVRGQFVKPFYGERLYQAFRKLKRLFDPAHLMNPGKIVDTPAMTDAALLRYGRDYRVAEIDSAFAHADQGGFRLAVEQCNGVGACRKIGSGTMCPSYMATKNERDSTRGRANALRLAMSGQLGDRPEIALASPQIDAVLSLCLSCKACKQECPNRVDMSRLKADVLHLQHQQHGTPRGHRLIGRMPALAAMAAGPWAPVVNAMQASRAGRWALERWAGLDRRRVSPAFARRTLAGCLKSRHRKFGHEPRGRVVLFDDTYMRYFEPTVGLRALDLLESLGYEVTLANAGCCQRPAMSKGLLDDAATAGLKTMEALDRYAKANLTILAVEPSCASALTDDLPDLVSKHTLARRVAKQVRLLSDFLAEHHEDLQQLGLRSDHERLLVHGHCHEKALYGTAGLTTLLEASGATVRMTDAGCCGMAGSFGYEQYEISKQVAADRLLPTLDRHGDWAVAASGFSCRHQIRDFAQRDARHWLEYLTIGSTPSICFHQASLPPIMEA